MLWLQRSPTKLDQTLFYIDQLATLCHETKLIYFMIPLTTCKLQLREMFLYFLLFTMLKKQNLLFFFVFFATKLPTLER